MDKKLQEVLKKDTIGEEDLKVLSMNMNVLSDEDKVRFGFMAAPVKLATKKEAVEVLKKTGVKVKKRV